MSTLSLMVRKSNFRISVASSLRLKFLLDVFTAGSHISNDFITSMSLSFKPNDHPPVPEYKSIAFNI